MWSRELDWMIFVGPFQLRIVHDTVTSAFGFCPQAAFVLLAKHGLLHSLIAQTQFVMSR